MDISTPLAERMRPKTFEDYVSHSEIVGEGTPLRRVIASGYIPSMIFWGPPGSGKTTLAHILSQEIKRPFYSLSAINAGVKDVRDAISRAEFCALNILTFDLELEGTDWLFGGSTSPSWLA